MTIGLSETRPRDVRLATRRARRQHHPRDLVDFEAALGDCRANEISSRPQAAAFGLYSRPFCQRRCATSNSRQMELLADRAFSGRRLDARSSQGLASRNGGEHLLKQVGVLWALEPSKQGLRPAAPSSASFRGHRRFDAPSDLSSGGAADRDRGGPCPGVGRHRLTNARSRSPFALPPRDAAGTHDPGRPPFGRVMKIVTGCANRECGSPAGA